ncbi:hypothetical protein C2E23DRAFT_133672 [Lenzites betulinus]|nr:hypothetical protein C2E23DRAFT_133672 [Lenzites betulinus]
MATRNALRVGLYVLLWLFSAVLLGLAATRIHYTLRLPPGDPLNNGNSFYDPIVAELLVASLLALFWSSFIIHVIHKSRDYGRISSFAGELLGLLCLFALYLVGAAIASMYWGALFWCHAFWQCRVLTVLVAFAWMCWALVLALVFVSAMLAATNRAYMRPLHGRYDARDSFFQGTPKGRRAWGF